MALVGESGSGKSVTAMSILGLLPQQTTTVKGSVTFEGRELTTAPESTLRRLRAEDISLVFQDPLTALNPVYTVGHQVAELFRVRRGQSRTKARASAIEMLRRVRIPDPENCFDQYPHQFSGGIRQRALIAMALALDPLLLIADEPTTALDVTVESEILDLIRELSVEQNLALLFISHDLGVVADICEDITVLYGGRVFETGSVRAVFEEIANPYSAALLASIPAVDLRGSDLRTIPGRPPDPAAWPSGCRFAPRCWRKEAICDDSAPELDRVGPGHASRCHFSDDVFKGQRP